MLPKNVSAYITELPKRLVDPSTWSGLLRRCEEKTLFDYYPDEISFEASDFIGLTADEAPLLKFGRDRAWFQR
ncbi:MAG: hypothetical protein ABR507_10350 [Actinomycetota bacterium]|nr:hypothetical protein [Actinomycetota bacterium]